MVSHRTSHRRDRHGIPPAQIFGTQDELIEMFERIHMFIFLFMMIFVGEIVLQVGPHRVSERRCGPVRPMQMCVVFTWTGPTAAVLRGVVFCL